MQALQLRGFSEPVKLCAQSIIIDDPQLWGLTTLSQEDCNGTHFLTGRAGPG